MCCWAEVSESGYHAWRRTGPTPTARRRAELTTAVKRVWEASNRCYGYRKVHVELVRSGVACSDGMVRSIMADNGWESCHPRPWRVMTEQDPAARPAPDLIGREFRAARPGTATVGDITQIDTWEGPVFLATVIDLCSKEVIGWAMADHYQADLVCDAVVMAKRNHRLQRRAIFHSDRGSQYTSKTFRKCLKHNRMRQSMGKVGYCFDNALAESFFASLKKELCDRTVFATRAICIERVANYIEVFYNRRRLHQGLGYRTPAEIREQYRQTSRAT